MVIFRKIVAAILVIGGLAAFSLSLYISDEVAKGNIKVEKAEKAVQTGDRLFSLSPVGKEIGDGITQSAKKKIGEGKEMIAYYAARAEQLKIGGIVAVVIGLVLFCIPKKKRAR